jgi:2-keto-4-pentenoate hydratase
VLWLANHLAAEGIALQRGEIVMTGSLVTTKFPTGPGGYRFEVSGLGSVALTVA